MQQRKTNDNRRAWKMAERHVQHISLAFCQAVATRVATCTRTMLYHPAPAAANKSPTGSKSTVPLSLLADMLICISTAKAAAGGMFGNMSWTHSYICQHLAYLKLPCQNGRPRGIKSQFLTLACNACCRVRPCTSAWCCLVWFSEH